MFWRCSFLGPKKMAFWEREGERDRGRREGEGEGEIVEGEGERGERKNVQPVSRLHPFSYR